VFRGDISLLRGKSNEIMKVDEQLISAKGLPWQKPISLAHYGSMSDSAI
jgi:hypothetical protein